MLATRRLDKGLEMGFGIADARRFHRASGLLEWVLGDTSQEFSIHWNEELLEHWGIWHHVYLGKWGGCGKFGESGNETVRAECLSCQGQSLVFLDLTSTFLLGLLVTVFTILTSTTKNALSRLVVQSAPLGCCPAVYGPFDGCIP